ncbi:hypothetical protein [Actinoplanes regularis]|uniref:HEAT repeat-containing protein n=1 Tax=Actinoplanes regularis TaxID=52697 RepID=A0A239E0F1_9ACTN|nr:hypothetical protein [Actinoplanes regularis]GIE88938.1 hypothetical protein Are01nite_54180 [Actinoplanes regularis]SNS37452.1 hypothetical protein SAMN06264365_114165 [Actinoplanes regularis]
MTEIGPALTSVYDIDWQSLEFGSAVARMLAELTAGDPAAIQGLYRIAPDGEDVQPWVVAALPLLLELVADTGRPDRGPVLRLVADLAGADRTWQMSGETLRAKRLLAGHPGLDDLLTDDDPRVREAAAYAVRAVARLAPRLPGLLWERYTAEPDPAVRVTLLRSGVIAGAVGSGHELTKVWLAWVADSDADLRVRITALTEMVALADPPPFDVETARDTVLAAYRAGLNREPAPLDETVAPLLAGQRMAAREWTPGYHQVVSAVRVTYRNDVGEHLELLQRMLQLDARDARQDALHQARSLVQRLRGPYRPLVLRAAELLSLPSGADPSAVATSAADGDPQVRAAALRLLLGIGEVARPAADAVWATLPRTGQRIRPHAGQGWVVPGLSGPVLGPAVRILAGLRDERILPMLERLLDEVPDANRLYPAIAGFGLRARGLSRTLRRRLRAVGPAEAHRAGLLRALTAVAPNDAADHLLREPIDLTTLGLLARAGRAVAGRAPDLRAALTCGDPALELAAAHTIWHVTGDVAAAAAVYDRYFDDRRTRPEHAVAAIDGLKALGIRVKTRARRLAALTGARTDDTVVAAAADALWWVAGNRDAVQRLGRVWESAPRTRARIARLWMATGDVRYGARYARAELDTVLRHNVSNLGLPAAEVSADERLLDLCRKLLA